MKKKGERCYSVQSNGNYKTRVVAVAGWKRMGEIFLQRKTSGISVSFVKSRGIFSRPDFSFRKD
jgi:hypothetical protein